ncbi:MAG: hypothetical protein OXU20_16645 [Myxococcales bacterium]|nr:hypothetical protein [Myxococcales bacterium]
MQWYGHRRGGGWRGAVFAAGILAACGSPTENETRGSRQAVGTASDGSQEATGKDRTRARDRRTHVRVVERRDLTPPGGDGGPRLTLALVRRDGSELMIDGDAVAYTEFRDGVAFMEPSKRLVLIAGDGSRRVLAQRSAAPPVRAPDGALIYGVRHGLTVELHALFPQGGDRVLATLAGSIGMFAPQADGSVIFVATESGGRAGLWHANGGQARCLTNCKGHGAPLQPVPGRASDLSIAADELTWIGFDGARHAIPWPPSDATTGNETKPGQPSGDKVRAEKTPGQKAVVR